MAGQPMLERIARVLCDIDMRDPDAVVIGEGKATGRTWLGWHSFGSDARDALAAIREPTPAVLEALDGVDAADRWRAAIDAELANPECAAVRLG